MSNYNSLKATINANIKTNGNEEITGQVLNSVLNAMVNTIGAGYQYMGVATPSTDPGSPDARVFYVAAPGAYSQFGVTIQPGYIGLFRYDSQWNTDTLKLQMGEDEFEDIVDAVIQELEGGGGSISEGDYPKRTTILYSGNATWQSVGSSTTIRGELIPLESGVEYTLTFANGLGGYCVVLDSNPVAGNPVNWADGYSSLVNTTQGQVVRIQGVAGQYLFVRADLTLDQRVFPIIKTRTGDSIFVLSSDVESAPTQGSNGVVKSGGLYTLFNTINTILSDLSEAMPIGRSDPPGRQDVPVSGVNFLNKYPGYYGGTQTGDVATRAVSSIIPIPVAATGIHASIATGYKGILYFLRSNQSWDSSVPSSGGWSTTGSVYLALPVDYQSGGAILYMMKESGENISPTEAKGAVSEIYYDVPDSFFLPVASKEMAQKSISILFVGNSLTQDSVSYVPYLLRNLYPNIDFKFYVWYNGGYTLAQHYTKMQNNQTCETFSRCENSVSWVNSSNSVTMRNICDTYKFDIVCLQEYFNYKQSFTEADLVDFNNVVSYIRSNYTRNFKVVSLFHAPKRGSNVHNIFNLTKSGNELILKKTSSQSLIAPGVAIYRALSTTLNSLGDQGGLSSDGTHTQEGLPCLLQAWVVFIWIMRQLSIPISIENCQLKMTTAIYNTINVPGANLGTGVIEGTQAENWLAQDVAILGDKEGIGIEQNSFITMYE